MLPLRLGLGSQMGGESTDGLIVNYNARVVLTTNLPILRL